MTHLRISGMTCSNCARHVTEAIQGVPGVGGAMVSLEGKSAAVRWNAGKEENVPAVIQAVAQAGYQAAFIQPGDAASDKSRRGPWQWNLILGIAVTAGLMLGEWVLGLAMAPWFRWTSFALAGAVQIFAGAPFYRGAWSQLKAGSSNMDTLVALGSTTAFGYSAWALLSGAGGELYFMEAAAVITLISLGHWLEARASEKAGGALKSLLQLAPQAARRIQMPEARSRKPDFDLRTASFSPSAIGDSPRRSLGRPSAIETEVPVAELQMGDQVALRPGDRVPVDGIVAEGDSAVNESMLTGESIPADKKPGSRLFAGTVNLNGRLVLRVTATGEATALAHIIAAVLRAQSSRADIQRLGDRVSSIFVPVVVAVAILAGLWWGLAQISALRVSAALAPYLGSVHPLAGSAAGFIVAAAVLIVACPCAMGLATPAAIMAGANAAARRGILIRDGVALEKAGKITAVVFDKTGTLTSGLPEVAQISEVGGRKSEVGGQKSEVRNLAAALARHSTHPVSSAIAKVSPAEMELGNWKEIRGCGIEAGGPDLTYRLGSLRWLDESGVDLAAGGPFVAEWSNQGATIVGLAWGKNLLALFAVRDALKPGTAEVVEQLRRQGLSVFLVSGDNPLTTKAIAKQAGIAPENVFAGVRPEEKAGIVKKLQAGGSAGGAARVAFVGDGINDAPALEAADLGIAVSRASDVAREAADIILLKSGIEAVPEALGLARATLRTIRQNLFWAFFYNALGVPLAALGFLSPILCAAAMGVSDLVVIGNALRLLRWRK